MPPGLRAGGLFLFLAKKREAGASPFKVGSNHFFADFGLAWVNAVAATLLCAGVDLGLLSILDAKLATRAEVCSLVGFFEFAIVFSFRPLGIRVYAGRIIKFRGKIRSHLSSEISPGQQVWGAKARAGILGFLLDDQSTIYGARFSYKHYP